MSPFTINGYTDAFLFLTDDNQLSMTENGSAEEIENETQRARGEEKDV